VSVDDGRELVTICRGGAYIGVATNNVAEYRALVWGLRNALELRVRRIDVRADSELLVKQLLGVYRVKNAGIKPLFAEARRLLEAFVSYDIKHVLREYNSAADALANEAMDTHGAVGDFVVSYDAGELFSALSLGAGVADASGNASAVVPDVAPAAPAAAAAAPAAAPAADGFAPAPGTCDRTSSPGIKQDKEGATMTESKSTGTYTLTIKEHFDAAHALIGYPGECRNLHGHTWDIEVSVRGSELDEVGIVYDFKDLKSNLMGILDQFDHKYLNEVPPFDSMNATAENLARVIYEQLSALLPEGIELVEVAVWESPIARLVYSR
jgi:6-pyruvoyltetrahydropterin/6-carboxytetrahydropterin synthase